MNKCSGLRHGVHFYLDREWFILYSFNLPFMLMMMAIRVSGLTDAFASILSSKP